MKIHIDIRNDIEPTLALECVKKVIENGRISKDNTQYCWLTTFDTQEGEIRVWVRDYRKSDCFMIYKG